MLEDYPHSLCLPPGSQAHRVKAISWVQWGWMRLYLDLKRSGGNVGGIAFGGRTIFASNAPAPLRTMTSTFLFLQPPQLDTRSNTDTASNYPSNGSPLRPLASLPRPVRLCVPPCGRATISITAPFLNTPPPQRPPGFPPRIPQARRPCLRNTAKTESHYHHIVELSPRLSSRVQTRPAWSPLSTGHLLSPRNTLILQRFVDLKCVHPNIHAGKSCLKINSTSLACDYPDIAKTFILLS
ncbi:hypothetical protein C8R46DRAFT_1309324 [Mycena filopes]|nr:hypothetical protein C8R46DRAFT_1309324 [Mycena filopes]